MPSILQPALLSDQHNTSVLSNTANPPIQQFNPTPESSQLSSRRTSEAVEPIDQRKADSLINEYQTFAEGDELKQGVLRSETQEDRAFQQAAQQSQEDQTEGEWINSVQAIPPNEKDQHAEEAGKVVLPAFYRTPEGDQDALTHRLAVLGVNNYSGEYGVTEAESDATVPLDHDRQLARRELDPTASEQDVESLAVEIRTHAIAEKEKEIKDSLQNDPADELKKKIIPPELLEHSHDVKPPVHERTHTSPYEGSGDAESEDSHSDIDFDGPAMTDENAIALTEQEQAQLRKDKLDALIEEFGKIDIVFEGNDKEQYLSEARGALFRGIIILGKIHLTTHRLTFHAVLPPSRPVRSGDGSTTILHSGGATIHSKNAFGGKTARIWMELDTEMITTYPSADETGRVKPLKSILLESVDQLYPLESANPFELKLRYSLPKGEKLLIFSVDTPESALDWHRDLQAALFSHGRARRYEARMKAREEQAADRPNAPSLLGDTIIAEDDGGWEILRICLPLHKLKEVGCEDYMGFARILSLDVDVMHNKDRNAVIAFSNHFERVNPINPTFQDLNSHKPERKSKLEQITDSIFHRGAKHKEDKHKEETLPNRSCYSDATQSTHPMYPADSQNATRRTSTGSDYATPESEEQTSGASIVPAERVNFGTSENKEMRTAINLKFGLLNGESDFGLMVHNALQAAYNANRRERPGADLVVPILQSGCANLLRLPEVEGGAGLPEEALASPPAPKQIKKRTRKEIVHQNDVDADSEQDYESDSDSDLDETVGEPGGDKRIDKIKNAQQAKAIFGIPEHENVWMKRCYLNRTVPFRGHIILSDKYLCFWRKQAGMVKDIKYRFPVHDIKGARALESFRFKFRGLAIEIAGRHDLHFDFFSPKARSHTIDRINQLVKDHAASHKEAAEFDPTNHSHDDKAREAAVSTTLDLDEINEEEDFQQQISVRLKTMAILGINPEQSMNISVPDEALAYLPAVVNDFGGRRHAKPRRFALLTIGSRGDVQPYIALALGLMEDGHQVMIVTHDEFKEWVEGYGIEHRQAGGDPAALMKLSVEHAMFSPGFFKESLGGFRTWLDDLLRDAWIACRDADVLIESPSAMAGIHIAEALKIPYMRAFTMPWTRTSKYPQAFMVPAVEMGPGFNYSSYVLFDNIIWKATSLQINPWRKKLLGLPPTDMSKLSQTKVPFMYNFSPTIVPKPLDWHDDIALTGYWNLANSDTDWTPPSDLDEFIEKAKRDGKPLVYIGFGSITVPDPQGMTRNIIKAVDKADVRAIIAKGWSSKGSTSKAGEEGEPVYSSNCYPIDKIPHGWLFPKVKAALHHGGAGTVGASLTAGLPTLIKPWFGDQFFWAQRVTHLGVGLKIPSLDADDLADALNTATRDTVMVERAAMLGEKIRRENGVKNAIEYIYANLPRAAKDRTQLKWQRA